MVNAGILVFAGADELDVVGPYRVLAAASGPGRGDSLKVVTVGEHTGQVTLGNGLRLEPDVTFDTCPPLDVLIVPGGSSDAEEGRRKQQRNETVRTFIASRSKQARITGSVCTGAFLLAEAGLLAGRKANTHWRFRDELAALMRERGENFTLVPDRVVWDGHLVTGGGVTSGIDVGLSILAKLYGGEFAAAVGRALEVETPI